MTSQQLHISFETLLNQISDLVQLFDHQGHLIYVNQRWCEALGYSPEEARTLAFCDLLLFPKEWNHLRHLLEQPSLHERDLTLLTRSGQHIVVSASFSQQPSPEGIPCYLGVFQNITSNCTADDNLRLMNEELERRVTGRTADLAQVNMILKDEIDARERVEEALRASEENWRSLVENAPDFIMTIDPQHRIQFTNRPGPGLTLDDVIGSSVYDYVPPDHKQRMKEAFDAVFRTSQPTNYEIALMGTEGEYHWFASRVSPLIRGGKVTGLTLISTDITDQRSIAEALRESEARFRAIIETTPVSIIITQIPSGRILFANEAAGEILGQPHDTLIGMRGEDFYYNSTERTILFDTLEREGGVRSYEFRIRRADGSPAWIVTSMTPITFDGKPALLGTSYDITARKNAEEELNRIFTLSKDMLGIAGFDGYFKRLNPSWEVTFGYTSEELMAEPYLSFIHPEDRAPTRAEAAKMSDGCPSVNFENRFRCKDGNYRWLSWSSTPHMEGRFYFVARDITERKDFEEKIQLQNRALIQANTELAAARQNAEEASRLKSQFLATMSHELRTPLNAIIGYTDILLAGMAGDLNEEQHNYQQRIIKNAEHLLSLINDILDLAKIEAGRVEIVRKPFALKTWMDEIVLQTQGLAEKKGLTFTAEMDNRVPASLIGDPGRLKQIAINLLSNAIKFTDRGVIRFSIRKQGKDAWSIAVQDTGIGIPPHMQETIFDEFRQVDGTSRRKHGGTGLGLAIVRKLALTMGGNVRVKSKLGEGSTFTVFLPMNEVENLDVEPVEYDAH